jgi:hypothetical protein
MSSLHRYRTSVGEQLRPHLFRLLALSGASYPPSVVHVAAAASKVIITFAEHRLNRQLARFIHDRMMMVRMPDDVKEQSGMAESTAAAQQAVPTGLTGGDAEKDGIMVIALTNVVRLVFLSLKYKTVELVKDFEAAGGYDVLKYTIYHATGDHRSKLMALLPLLPSYPN